MSYKGYMARIEYDDDDEIFVGRLVGIDDVVGFHAETVADLKTAFHEAVDDYVASCERIGKTPEKPYSGRVMFRIAPEVHARAALAAELSGRSLNQWAEDALDNAASVRLVGFGHSPDPADSAGLSPIVELDTIEAGPPKPPPEPLKPVVPIRKSITPDYLICLEDGKKLKMLKRHLKTAYNMSPESYRERWGLSPDYPMVAPNYARQRSEFAKTLGLGRGAERRSRGAKR